MANALSSELVIVNCHQNTETADLLGGFRPVRGRGKQIEEVTEAIKVYFRLVSVATDAIATSLLAAEEGDGMEVDAEGDGKLEEKGKLEEAVSLLREGCAELRECKGSKAVIDHFMKTKEGTKKSLALGKKCEGVDQAVVVEAEDALKRCADAADKSGALFLWYFPIPLSPIRWTLLVQMIFCSFPSACL